VLLALPGVLAAAPASAGVLAYRTSDGSPDQAFIKLGAFTTVQSVVPDGGRGAFLIGSIAVDGSQRKMVHLLADGSVDPAFRPVIHGGRVVAAAISGAQIAVVGTFTAIGAQARAGIAVLAADTGRPLPWRPVVPGRARSQYWGDVAFTGAELVVNTLRGIYGWRPGASRPAWKASLALDASTPARLAEWRGSVVVLYRDASADATKLATLAPGDGRRHGTGFDAGDLQALYPVGGRLLARARGGLVAVGEKVTSARLARCDAAADRVGIVVGLTGDAHTLYYAQAILNGRSPSTPDVSGPDVAACRFDGGATAFAAPPLANRPIDPIAQAIALVGHHVLIFTKRL
jgi:hypothetical protein